MDNTTNNSTDTKKKERTIFIVSILLTGLFILLLGFLLSFYENPSRTSIDFWAYYWRNFFVDENNWIIGWGGYLLGFTLSFIFAYFTYKKNKIEIPSYRFIIYFLVIISLPIMLLLSSNSYYKCNLLTYSEKCKERIREHKTTLVVQSLDVDKCKNIKSNALKSEEYGCITAVAVAKRDISLCDKISDRIPGGSSPFDYCILKIVAAENNFSLNRCSSSKAYKCLTEMAVELRDAKPCLTAEKMSGDLRDWCLHEVAIAENDIEICFMIEETALKSICSGKVRYSQKE